MTCEECMRIGIPKMLCSEGKPKELAFLQDERVYRRHNQMGSEHDLKHLDESVLGNKVFPVKNDSYNRSSLSVPQNVLLSTDSNVKGNSNYYAGWGIISLDVAVVNGISGIYFSQDQAVQYRFEVVHIPIPCNYSHAEVHLFLNGTRYDGKAPKNAKTLFRRTVQNLLTVVKETATP